MQSASARASSSSAANAPQHHNSEQSQSPQNQTSAKPVVDEQAAPRRERKYGHGLSNHVLVSQMDPDQHHLDMVAQLQALEPNLTQQQRQWLYNQQQVLSLKGYA